MFFFFVVEERDWSRIQNTQVFFSFVKGQKHIIRDVHEDQIHIVRVIFSKGSINIS